MDITALTPRRRNFNLRTEDPETALVTSPAGHGAAPKKESKRSRLSRLFHSTTSSSQKTKSGPEIVQTSRLLSLPSAVLDTILYYALDLPQNVSLNFPYSPLPAGCAFHLAHTPPPALFSACRTLRQRSQHVFFVHNTFNITLLAGGPTAHFWLKHDWAGNFVGPAKTIRSVLPKVQNLSIVAAVPGYDGKAGGGGLAGDVKLATEREDWDAIRKCLAIVLAYVQNRRLSKHSERELSKQIEQRDKGKNADILRTGEGIDGGEDKILKCVSLVLSKRNPGAVVTTEVFEILDIVGEIKVEGDVEVVLECREQEEGEKARTGRKVESESALSKEWPNREEVLNCRC